MANMKAAFAGPAKTNLICRLLMIAINMIIIFLLIAVCVLGSSTSSWDDNATVLFAGMALMAPVWSLVYSIVIYFVMLKHTNYHPGWDVGFDLIGWLMFWVWAPLLLALWASPETSIYCLGGAYYAPSYCDRPGVRDMVRCEMAAAAFMIINGIFIFVYFIIACRRTELRRRQKFVEEVQRAVEEVEAQRNKGQPVQQQTVQPAKQQERWEVPPIEGQPPTYSV